MFTATYPITTSTIIKAIFHKVGQTIKRGTYNLVKTKPTNCTSSLFMGTFVSVIEKDTLPTISVISTANVEKHRYLFSHGVNLLVLNGWYMVIDTVNDIAPDKVRPSKLVDIYIGMFEGFYYIRDNELGTWEFMTNTEATANI